jgi:hypothetical protein
MISTDKNVQPTLRIVDTTGSLWGSRETKLQPWMGCTRYPTYKIFNGICISRFPPPPSSLVYSAIK